MMQPILAIDPGAGGGFALRAADGTVSAAAMPEGMSEQIDALRSYAAVNPGLLAVLENVGGYMPGNSGPAACRFARHCGHLEAALYAIAVPSYKVAPQRWMKALGALPKEKPDRKRRIKELMAARFPHLTVTLATADALGILVWSAQSPADVGP